MSRDPFIIVSIMLYPTPGPDGAVCSPMAFSFVPTNPINITKMASVEDLIATMNSGVHVGKQGYDLTALQVG